MPTYFGKKQEHIERNNMLQWLTDKVLRNGLLLTICYVVMFTSTSTRLTQSIMWEIAGYAALAVAIANVTVYTYTQISFVSETNREGRSNHVLAAIILGSFLLVGMCVLGMYFSKIDGVSSVLPTM